MEQVDAKMLMNDDLNRKIVNNCIEVAKGKEITAISIYGSRAGGYAREDSDYDILLVVNKYPQGVRYYYTNVEDKQFAILIVDQEALELDAEKGDLGDFVAGRLLTPYIPLRNAAYMRKVEITTKRRFVEEDLEDLIIDYGELSRGLIIRPEYLVLARMEKRSRAYPPLKYSYMNMLREDLKETNMKNILVVYDEIFDSLVTAGILIIGKGEIKLTDSFVDKVLQYKILNKVVNLMDFSKRAFHSYITHSKAGRVRLDIVAKELASKIKREIKTAFNGLQLEDPKNYVFLKTEQGLVSLNKKDTIIEKIRRIKGNGAIDIKALAGALNEVFLVTLDDEKLVVKKFTDWYNLKWFILNIAAYGTKSFSLSGKSRLSNEYVMNQTLANNDIRVPEIISISIQDRMLIVRYIRGKSFLEVVIESINSDSLNEQQSKCAFEVGCLLARIHKLSVTMGDCKPENFILGIDREIYVLDLEQGERLGDKAWDVAEFLYFSGHFASKLTNGLKEFATDFSAGYASVCSNQVLKEAAGLRYMRIFFTWTPMPILQAISNILKNGSLKQATQKKG